MDAVDETDAMDAPVLADVDQPKKKTRQRLLRGLQRVSSSPALAQLGRMRSSSSPASLSCISLASSSSPSPLSRPSPPSSGSYFPPSSSGGSSSSGSPDSPFFDGIETVLAARRAELPPRSATATASAAALVPSRYKKQAAPSPWTLLPREIKLHVLSFLRPRELVRASGLSRELHGLCFDGQLWACLDASDFYREIPAESLAKLILAAGPFVRDLNLRGCVQVAQSNRAEAAARACGGNLVNATLEGCRYLHKSTLHSLLRRNDRLAYLNVNGLPAVTNKACRIVAASCRRLEVLNVSWCRHMDAAGLRLVVESCPRLRDLRAREIRGFDDLAVADALFRANSLDRLVLADCPDLSDDALHVLLRGRDPEFDLLTERPLVAPRRLRHLDLSRCTRLTTDGVRALDGLVPLLEGIQLTGVVSLTDAALEPLLATAPLLTHLELEDLPELTDALLADHLARAPCAPRLQHLSVSYCENISDAGMVPVVRACTALRSVDMDNTRISDHVLAEAAAMVASRSSRTADPRRRPRLGLSLVVYDCHHVSWAGAREVLCRNAEPKQPPSALAAGDGPSYPTEVVGLKCFYGWQMTVDEHTKRVLRADWAAAARLESKWADYMQASEEAGVGGGAGGRRRRRRAREAQQAHADEEDAGPARRRARTAACSVM